MLIAALSSAGPKRATMLAISEREDELLKLG